MMNIKGFLKGSVAGSMIMLAATLGLPCDAASAQQTSAQQGDADQTTSGQAASGQATSGQQAGAGQPSMPRGLARLGAVSGSLSTIAGGKFIGEHPMAAIGLGLGLMGMAVAKRAGALSDLDRVDADVAVAMAVDDPAIRAAAIQDAGTPLRSHPVLGPRRLAHALDMALMAGGPADREQAVQTHFGMTAATVNAAAIDADYTVPSCPDPSPQSRAAGISSLMAALDALWGGKAPISDTQRAILGYYLRSVPLAARPASTISRLTATLTAGGGIPALEAKWTTASGLAWPDAATPYMVLPSAHGGQPLWWNLVPLPPSAPAPTGWLALTGYPCA